MSKKILVTGANGQVGSELRALATQYSAYEISFLHRSDLDLSETHKVEAYFEKNHFDVVINCAAYTAVDKAELEEDMAHKINYRAVEVMASAAKRDGFSLIHISTDYVFDGSHYKPYSESEPTNPQGAYGASKLYGEDSIMMKAPKNSLIIRTAWVYSTYGKNFVKTMLRLSKERDTLGVIFDQIGTPTYARDLAKLILDIIPQIENETPEVYHYSNEGVSSWYDFAKAIFEIKNISCKVNSIETSEYPTPARRPYYGVLNKTKIKQAFKIEIPHWRESLKDALKEME